MPRNQPAKGQLNRRGQMNKSDMERATPESTPRDDLRTAYSGDENRGPARHQKTSASTRDKTKGRRLPSYSAKTPVR